MNIGKAFKVAVVSTGIFFSDQPQASAIKIISCTACHSDRKNKHITIEKNDVVPSGTIGSNTTNGYAMPIIALNATIIGLFCAGRKINNCFSTPQRIEDSLPTSEVF